MKERVKWIDVAKAIGMFLIYIGHLPTNDKWLGFIFTFHVPLFFLLSGMSEHLSTERTFLDYCKLKLKTLVIPIVVYVALSVSLLILQGNGTEIIGSALGCLAKGCIRNGIVSYTMWFLSCLFVMQIAFYWIKKIKFKPCILLVGVVLFVVAHKLIDPLPLILPHMVWNIDSACYYIIFYVVGYLAYPFIAALFKLDSIVKNIVFVALFIASLTFSLNLFTGIDLFPILATSGANVMMLREFIYPIIAIMTVLAFSKILENLNLLSEIGKSTLHLCGSEFIVKTIIPVVLGTIGLNITYAQPINVFFYCFIIIVLTTKYVVPYEKRLLNKVNRTLRLE